MPSGNDLTVSGTKLGRVQKLIAGYENQSQACQKISSARQYRSSGHALLDPLLTTAANLSLQGQRERLFLVGISRLGQPILERNGHFGLERVQPVGAYNGRPGASYSGFNPYHFDWSTYDFSRFDPACLNPSNFDLSVFDPRQFNWQSIIQASRQRAGHPPEPAENFATLNDERSQRQNYSALNETARIPLTNISRHGESSHSRQLPVHAMPSLREDSKHRRSENLDPHENRRPVPGRLDETRIRRFETRHENPPTRAHVREESGIDQKLLDTRINNPLYKTDIRRLANDFLALQGIRIHRYEHQLMADFIAVNTAISHSGNLETYTKNLIESAGVWSRLDLYGLRGISEAEFNRINPFMRHKDAPKKWIALLKAAADHNGYSDR